MGWNLIEYTESYWRNLDMTLLGVDESYINLLNETPDKLFIYYLREDCFRCPYRKLKYDKETIKIDVFKSIGFKFFKRNQGKYVFDNETESICNIESHVGEFGVYNLTVSNNKDCSIIVDKEPVNIYISMFTVLLIGICVAILFKSAKFLWHKYKNLIQSPTENSVESARDENANKKKRLKSLDIFRGLAITLMIFVNSGGGHYYWIEHSPWNGLHIADIVFPSFLWIMGVAIPFSIHVQLNRSVSKIDLLQNVLIRSIKLFLIGLCLNSVVGSLENLRIMGVLQRFGISYFICASFYVIFAKNPLVFPTTTIKMYIYDIILMREQLILCIILIIVHLSIAFGLKVPNCPQGYLGPGGIHDYAAYPNCTGGATGYIDELILGKSHLYQHSTARELYDSKNFDPEGLFGTLLSIVQVSLGVQCGVILKVYTCWKARSLRLAIWTLMLIIIGGSLCSFSNENGIIPINKNLWSLSFVLITCGIAFLILLVLYAIVDIKTFWSGSPFLQAGMNPIILYVGHSVLHKMLPWHWRIGLMNTHFILLIEAVWNTSVWVLIATMLYDKNIFYNV